MMLQPLFRVLFLWFMLHMSFTTAGKPGMGQKDKIAGRVAPQALIGELPPTSIDFTRAGKIFPGKILKAVLKDQLGIDEPEKGPVYVFINFRPGALYEDIVNGGGHVVLIVASWGQDDAMDFQAQLHHLVLDDCGHTEHDKAVFDFDQAYACVKYNNRFRALGKSGAGSNMDDVLKLINRESKQYFKNNPNYNYLLNNCGDYVQAMVDLTMPEHAALEVVLSPPMRLV